VVLKYPAVNAAIARFEGRLKSDRDLQRKFKRAARKLKIEI
jgi:predicted component of type VI protein secretion system